MITKYSQLNLTFREEMLGHSSGQSDLVIWAIDSLGNRAGYLSYFKYIGQPSIKMIEVFPRFKRQGVGKALLLQLQKSYPEEEIDWGYTTPEGTLLKNSLKFDFVENEEYSKFSEEKKSLQVEYEILLKKSEGGFKTKNPDTRNEMLGTWERMNEIDSRLWEIDDVLRDDKSGKKIIVGLCRKVKKYSQLKLAVIPEGKKYNLRAIKQYGLTNSPEDVGFITPSGHLIDSSGASQGNFGHGRVIDHRQIASFAVGDDADFESAWDNLQHFIYATGNIRIIINTPDQLCSSLCGKRTDGKTVKYLAFLGFE